MSTLAGLLSARFGGARAFFCNSGAEAVEAALKWARKATGKPEVVALEGSFHGRTHGALAVTGQPAKRAAWEPLSPAARFARLNDVESLAALVGPETAAILIEPVQGEGGIHPATPDFLAAARALADEHGALLIFDEVQCGTGRTGSFFAWEQLGVAPDALVAREGARERAADRCAARRGRRARGPRARRSRQHLRRQPGRVRRRLRGRRDDRRAAAARGARRTARSSPPGSPRSRASSRCAAAA